jgi:Mrp family chromosome partitioning ATPase
MSERIACRMQLIAHKIMVLSGKGGVGKSTVAANLAVSLAAAGLRTGLLDIDIHGPSIPKLLGLEGAPLPGPAEMLLPVSFNENLKVMSIGFLLPDDREAVIWRGPMKHKLISQFLAQVEWGELDYLVVDSPPGTGDEPLSIAQLVHGADGAIVVTTPQEVALSDVRKSIRFCHRVGLPVIGVIENMSGFLCPRCGEHLAPFGEGGGERMAQEMSVPFLGRLPMDPSLMAACDAGTPIDAGPDAGATGQALGRVIEGILQQIGSRTPAATGGSCPSSERS